MPNEILFEKGGGWAVDYVTEDSAICIYTFRNKVFDFQPVLKRIIEDAFDSKVLSWLNSLDYVEDAEEQARIKTLVVQEIKRFNRWMFGAECDGKAVAGVQSRYILLKPGRNDPQIRVSIEAEHVRQVHQKITVDTYKDTIRDNQNFPDEYYNYPAFILLCMLTADAERPFWVSLSHRNATTYDPSTTLNKIQTKMDDQTTFGIDDVLESYLDIGNMNVDTGLNVDAATENKQYTHIATMVRKLHTRLSNEGETEGIIEYLQRHLSDLMKIRIRIAGQVEILNIKWDAFFYRLVTAFQNERPDEVIFNNSSGLYDSNVPPGFQTFCEELMLRVEVVTDNTWNFTTQLEAGVVRGPTKDNTTTKRAKQVSKDGTMKTGMDVIYDKYRESAEEPRRYRLGQDLLSMHNIHPMSSSFYESARLEAYFRVRTFLSFFSLSPPPPTFLLTFPFLFSLG